MPVKDDQRIIVTLKPYNFIAMQMEGSTEVYEVWIPAVFRQLVEWDKQCQALRGEESMSTQVLSPEEELLQELRNERIVCYSQSLGLWCVTNGLAKILATAPTRELAQREADYPGSTGQLSLF
jgi:hypothetical protein